MKNRINLKAILSSKNIFLILILILALVLRFYRITDRISLYGDNTRDFLIIYKIVNFKEWVWNGPAVSGIWTLLSPVYYYLLTPFFALANFDPRTPFFIMATINIATVAIMYFTCYELFGKKAAIISSLIYSFSKVIITQGVLGTNPAFIPPFTLLGFYSLIKILDGKYNFILLGTISLSVLLSFHATGFFTIVPIVILLIMKRPNIKKRLLLHAAILFTILVIIPYAIQEWKFAGHNLRAVRELILGKPAIGFIQSLSNALTITANTSSSIIAPNLNSLGFIITTIVFILIALESIKILRKESKPNVILAFFFFIFSLTFVTVSKFQTTGIHDTWFSTVYLPLFVLYLGYALSKLAIRSKIGLTLTLIILLISFVLNLKSSAEYLDREVHHKLSKSLKITNSIIQKAKDSNFNIVLTTRDNYAPGGIPPLYQLLWSEESDFQLKEGYFSKLNWPSDVKHSTVFLVDQGSSHDFIQKQILKIKKDYNLSSDDLIMTNIQTKVVMISNPIE